MRLKWLATPSLAVGVIMIATAAFLVVRQTSLIAAGATATGEVIELQPSSGSRGGTLYRPVVRFVTEGGPTTIVGQVSSNPPAYAIGDAVRVFFESAPIGFDPAPNLAQGHIFVVIDPGNPARYWVDIDFRARAA